MHTIPAIPTKRELLDGLKINQAELSRLLGITRSAVAQWADDAPIPDKQWLKLRYEVNPTGIDQFAAKKAA